MSEIHRRLAGALLAVAVLIVPLSASAQMRGPAPAGRGITVTFGQPPQAHPFRPQNIFPAIPFFYPDYGSEPVVVQSPPPQVVVVQAPPAAAEIPEPSKPKLLMIEWRGDRYLRITGAEDAGARTQPTRPDFTEDAAARPKNAATRQPHQLLPAVIVFRDGRQEEVGSYAIMGAVMYVGKDYWTDGSWNEKVQLADLDVPATLRLNQERGVKFLLPSGPNEVVTRP